ncbi:MAG: glutathione S-transferase family protein, partial [Rhodomicrobium sp.]|nr:glutathione S-transferase family protein [Rhodomicrobium sp.]
MSRLELISNHLCPYTQRAVIQLFEKGVEEFDRIYIDLSDKPAWFRELSPFGKVPVLRTKDGALFESAIICEYLEETLPQPLHPQSPFERGRHRAWIEYSSSIIADVYGFYTAPAEECFWK